MNNLVHYNLLGVMTRCYVSKQISLRNNFMQDLRLDYTKSGHVTIANFENNTEH